MTVEGTVAMVFSFTDVLVSEVPTILKTFVSKEAPKLTLEATILKLYLAARPIHVMSLRFNSELAGSRKTCN